MKNLLVTAIGIFGIATTTLAQVPCNTPISLNSIPDQSNCEADLVTLTASATHTYNVDVTATSSMDFTFAGDFSGTDPVMNVSVGDTVVFNVNTPGHPFWINTIQGTGTSNGVVVTNNGTSSGTITWVPTALGTFYYNCQFHFMMTNTITVGAPAISYAWDNGVTNGVPFTPTASGDYIVIATDDFGCTDTDTVSVSILDSSTGTDVQTACETYDWIDGNTYTTSNNTAQWTLTNVAGCDSLVTLDLTVNYSNAGTDVQTACGTYDWIDGNTYTVSNNAAQWTLTNASGCDSLVTLDLTITPLPNTGVTQNETQLTAVQMVAAYQWLDCDNGNSVIASEINQFYTPTVTGNYAVEVTLNGCVDTSACYLVDYTGLSNLYNEVLSIHPNPAHDVLTINGINEIIGFNNIEIVSSIGEVVVSIEKIQEEVIVSALPSGVYFLNIKHDKGVESIRFVKQ
ncbi:MAG: T9SS type A sorting domain-containing protein [Crocinitomicaceae bacterium]|nr:T9SS type A sorting domain-containing protein [Crocinitomicaceae bacterium]